MKLCCYADLGTNFDPDLSCWAWCDDRSKRSVYQPRLEGLQRYFMNQVFWVIRSGPFETGHRLLLGVLPR